MAFKDFSFTMMETHGLHHVQIFKGAICISDLVAFDGVLVLCLEAG